MTTSNSFPALALVALFLSACASQPNRAPVEERQAQVVKPTAAGMSSPTTGSNPSLPVEPGTSKPPLGQENAGKSGYFTVKPGDTLIRIALDNGQNWKDVARWNGLDNPNLIEVGQVLRVQPPSVDPNAATSRPIAAAGRVEGRPLDGKVTSVATAASAPASAAPASAAAPVITPVVPTPASGGDENLDWTWPAAGPVGTPFDDNKSKGLAITGKVGDPVVAAADGRVVYAGAGLRGYGNLVIVKHNATYLTAYAHNQTLLVKEDQVVRRGQKIAEMGSSDADRVQLHFEIRRQGKPIDPAKLLPTR